MKISEKARTFIRTWFEFLCASQKAAGVLLKISKTSATAQKEERVELYPLTSSSLKPTASFSPGALLVFPFLHFELACSFSDCLILHQSTIDLLPFIPPNPPQLYIQAFREVESFEQTIELQLIPLFKTVGFELSVHQHEEREILFCLKAPKKFLRSELILLFEKALQKICARFFLNVPLNVQVKLLSFNAL